jgi:hypothetical protein
MALPWEEFGGQSGNPVAQSSVTQGAKPWEQDWSGTRTQVGIEAPQAPQGDFSRGVEAGVDSFQGSIFGLMGLVGDSAGNEELKNYGLEGYERNQKQAETVAPRVSSMKDIQGVGDLIDYTQGLLGQTTAFAGTSVAGGGVGGAVAKTAIKQMVSKGLSKEAAEMAYKAAMKNPELQKKMLKGVLAGSALAGTPSQQGDLYGRLKAEGIEDAVLPAWIGGAAMGALDVLPEARLLGNFLPKTVEKELADSFARGAKASAKSQIAKGIGKQALVEGSTEGAQETVAVLSRIYGDSAKGWTSEDVQNVLENFAAGAIVGSIVGTPGELLARRSKEKKPAQSKPNQEPGARRNDLPPEASDPIPQPGESDAQSVSAAAAPVAEAPVQAPEPVPAAAPTPEIKLDGMGKAMGENLRAQLWDSLQKGNTRMAGVKDPVLVAALPEFGAGRIRTRADFDAFLERYTNNEPAPAQEPQAPAPSVEPQEQVPVDAVRAPMGAPVPGEQMAAAPDAPIEDGSAPPDGGVTPEAMQSQAKTLRERIAQFKARAPVPTAEPAADLQAQIRDLRDDQNPRRGVYLSVDNLEQNVDLLNNTPGLAKIRNVDGQGGVMVMKLRDVAEFKARSEKGESRDALIGEFTRAGEGKPETDNPVVVQQKDEAGAVTAESVVDGNDADAVLARTQEFEQEGRTVEAVAPEAAIQRREEAAGVPRPEDPKPIRYNEAKTVEEFSSSLESAEFLDPENDGPQSRLEKAKFSSWILKGATPEQRAAYKKFKAARRGAADDNSVLAPDELDDIEDYKKDVKRLLRGNRVETEGTPSQANAEQELGGRVQGVESIIGKNDRIHGSKRVRSKAERVDPKKYKSPEHQAQAWTSDDGEMRAENMADNLNEADEDSLYVPRKVDAAEAEERGLSGPGWYVYQYPRDPVGHVESRYSSAYGARLTIPQVVRVGIARAKRRWSILPQAQKSPNNPQQWGVELANVDEEGNRKTSMAAAKEITEMGLQGDPALRNIENYNARMVAGFFHGVSMLYGGKAEWVPSESDFGKWIGPNTIIAESGGKKITIGNALVKASGVSASEKEVIRNLSGRDFNEAWNQIVKKRFENALRLGAPDAVAKRKAVEGDIKAARTIKRAEALIDALDKQLALEQNEEKRAELRLRRAKLMLEVAKAEARVGSVGFDPSADNAFRRKILDEVADQTEEDIYIPPEEVPLEQQEGDFILSQLESDKDQAKRSANISYTNDVFSSNKKGNSSMGTVSAGGSGAQTRAALAKDTRPQVLSPNATPEAKQYVADLRAPKLAPDQMEDGWFSKPGATKAAPAVPQTPGLNVDIKDPVRAAGSQKLVAAMKQYFGLNTNFYVTDSLDSLIATLRADGLGSIADQMLALTTETNGGWFYAGKPGMSYVYANPAAGNVQFIKGLSHEMGHVLDYQHFKASSPETQEALKKAWLKAKSSSDPHTKKRAERGFHEWKADQLAGWVFHNKQAKTLVEKYFASLADLLRKAWAKMQELWPLDMSFNEYLTGIARAADNARKVQQASLESLGGALNLAPDEMPDPKVWSQTVSDRIRAVKTKYKTVDSIVDFVSESAMAMHERLTASLHARITRMQVPAFDKLRRMFYLRPGEAGGYTYDAAVASRFRNFSRQFDTILESVAEEDRAKFHEFLQSERPTKDAPANIREAVAQFREFQSRVYAYQRDAHLPIRELYKEDKAKPAAERRGHFPQVADSTELLKPDAVDTIFAALQAAGVKMSRQDVVDMIANMTDDNFAVEFDPANIEDVSGNPRAPFYQSIRSRSLPDDVRKAIQGIKDEKGKPRFYAKDISQVMHSYLRQSTRRAEFNKILGDTEWDTMENGKFDSSRTFNAIMKEADAQGVSNENRAIMTDAMSAFMGQYNRIQSEPIKQIVKSVSFYQNLRTLMLVTVSSIPEFATMFLRTGNFGETWASVRRTAKDAFTGDTYKALRDYGFAVDGSDATAFNEIKDARDFSSKIDRSSEAFFRVIGLTKWTNWMRGVSLNVSLDYIKRHAQTIAEGRDQGGDSARRLEELGLTVEDVKAWAASGEKVYGTDGVTPEDIKLGRSELSPEQLESIRKVTGAIVRMTNQIVLNPNAAVKTLWRSDQHFALVGQLGSFTYAFLNEVLGRAWYEMTRNGATNTQRATVVASMALMMALTAFGLELKELLQYKLFGLPAPTDDMSTVKYLQTIVSRTGVLGTAQLGVDATSAAGANKSPLLAFAGPTLGQVSDAFTQPISKTVPGAIPFISQTPGVREELRSFLKGE